MNLDHKSRKILITGKSGSGKTTALIQLLMQLHCKRTYIFDPELEISRKLKFPTKSTVQELALSAMQQRSVCFDPAKLFPGRTDEGFAFFCEWVYRVSSVQRGRKLLVVDELQKFTRLGKGGIPKSFQVILDVGRRQEIDLLIIAQRPNLVNDAVRAQLTDIITLCHTDRLPLAWLEQDGFDPEAVRALPVPGGKIHRVL